MRIYVLLCLLLASCAPRPTATAPTAPDTGLRTLERSLHDLVGRHAADSAEISVALLDLATGDSLLIGAHTVMHAASTMKVPVMLQLFRDADVGRLRLDAPIEVRNRFRSIADGSAYSLAPGDDSDAELYARVGQSLPLRDLVERMIVRSSNLATNLLIDTADPQRVAATLAALNAGEVRVLRGVEDTPAYQRGMNNTTTAYGLMRVLGELAAGGAASPAATAEMVGILGRQHFRDMIPAGLPSGVRVANKTGWIPGINHDAAIVYPEGRAPYVLVVLTRGFRDRTAAHRAARDISAAVYGALASPGGAQGSGEPGPTTALVGATLIDGTGGPPIAEATVVVRDGIIVCAGRCKVPADARRIDARGKFIIPGLVDGHMHYSQTGWADGRPDALDLRTRFPYDSTVATLQAEPGRFFRSYLCSGVTATFDVGGYPWTWALREPAERSTAAPHVAAAGPLLSTRDHWVNLPAERQFVYMADDSATRAGARMIASRRSDAVKVWYLVGAATPDTAAWKARLRVAAAEANRAGIPLIVHATSLWAAKDALRAGAKLLVHSVEDQPVDEEFLRLARQAGAFYNPTLTVREGYAQLRERRFNPQGLPLECVDPATRAKAFLTDSLPGSPRTDAAAYRARIANEYRLMLANLKRVHDAGIPVVMGTDAGNPLTLHGPAVYREMAAMAEAGLSPMEVLVASTRHGARVMGREDFGTVEAGKIADLVVLHRNPLADIGNVSSVALVVRGGQVWTREELEFR